MLKSKAVASAVFAIQIADVRVRSCTAATGGTHEGCNQLLSRSWLAVPRGSSTSRLLSRGQPRPPNVRVVDASAGLNRRTRAAEFGRDPCPYRNNDLRRESNVETTAIDRFGREFEPWKRRFHMTCWRSPGSPEMGPALGDRRCSRRTPCLGGRTDRFHRCFDERYGLDNLKVETELSEVAAHARGPRSTGPARARSPLVSDPFQSLIYAKTRTCAHREWRSGEGALDRVRKIVFMRSRAPIRLAHELASSSACVFGGLLYRFEEEALSIATPPGGHARDQRLVRAVKIPVCACPTRSAMHFARRETTGRR